ncbi:MAG: hypothetical protein ACXWNI_07320 [Candidatus Limnocylindrales bacterium]
MTDFGRTTRPDVLVAGGQDLDGLLGPVAADLDALEARVAALERRLSAVPLMTAADAARYARVNVEAILRAVRTGEVAVAGYVGRSPGSLAMPSRLACHEITLSAAGCSAAPPVAPQPRRRRGRESGDAVEVAWRALG